MELWFLWLSVAVGCFIVEMLTPGTFYFACFGIGALVSAGLARLELDKWWMWGGFFITSLLCMAALRPLLKRLTSGADKPSNVDELIGADAVVTVAIKPHTAGQIKFRGEVWKASSDDSIQAGEMVEILKVDGVRLIVKRKG